MSEKCLLDQWRDIAYDEQADRGQLQNFWGTYFQIEKEIYEKLLSNPDEEVKAPSRNWQRSMARKCLPWLDSWMESMKA